MTDNKVVNIFWTPNGSVNRTLFLLTDHEQWLCNSLERFQKERYPGSAGRIRFAGGWVRDKLLGKVCSDIDVAVEADGGYAFAQKYHAYLIENKVFSDEVGLTEIKANPEMSKPLETGKLSFPAPLNIDVDFVGLTSPQSDVLRRDFTVNALFYNVTNKCVEDCCNGLQDLQNKILRTPQSASITLGDDPLRLVRAARFCEQLGFGLTPDFRRALDDPELGLRLTTKISPQRIVREFTKIWNSSSSPEAGYKMAQFLSEWGLLSKVWFRTGTLENLTLVREDVFVKALGAEAIDADIQGAKMISLVYGHSMTLDDICAGLAEKKYKNRLSLLVKFIVESGRIMAQQFGAFSSQPLQDIFKNVLAEKAWPAAVRFCWLDLNRQNRRVDAARVAGEYKRILGLLGLIH